jgi:hypothetical protein
MNGWKFRAHRFPNGCDRYSEPAMMTVKVRLQDLGPLELFVGGTSSGQNDRADIKVEYYQNSTLIASATETRAKVSGSTVATSKRLRIPITVGVTEFLPTDLLTSKIWVRKSSGSNFNTQVYFNAPYSHSGEGWTRIEKESSASGSYYYYRSNGVLSTSEGSSAESITVEASSDWTLVGTWSIAGANLKPTTRSATPGYLLMQNHPNPFGRSTSIEYVVPASAQVSLMVYDADGNRIATVVDEYQTAGRHTARFDGSNLASGTYTYVLRSDATVLARTMVLVR